VLVVSLYLIGAKRSLFSNTIRISSQFYNVNGLMEGNNVRYAGIDIGTVAKIAIENDSSVNVYMIIEQKHSLFIRKNSMVAIGTDGLMGNKLVNINPGKGFAELIQDGDVLPSVKPVENEEMVRTLNTTNENLAVITSDLRKFTSKLNKERGVLRLIDDSISAENIRQALVSIRDAAYNANQVSIQLNQFAADLNSGKGLAGTLLTDTVAASQMRAAIEHIEQVADSLTLVAGALTQFATGVNNPNGLAYIITSDTSVASDVRHGIKNLEEGTVLLNENLKAMRSNWLFRKYFKEEEKKNN
jgi:phospholipid/cholesterol/gamma-HCH transport system substrate-binding protein